MSAHVLLNLFNELGEQIRCEALSSILSFPSNEFKKSRFSHQNVKILPLESVTFLWTLTYNVTKHIKVICIFNPLVNYRF